MFNKDELCHPLVSPSFFYISTYIIKGLSQHVYVVNFKLSFSFWITLGCFNCFLLVFLIAVGLKQLFLCYYDLNKTKHFNIMR